MCLEISSGESMTWKQYKSQDFQGLHNISVIFLIIPMGTNNYAFPLYTFSFDFQRDSVLITVFKDSHKAKLTKEFYSI